MKKILYFALIFVSVCLTGCAGMTAAGMWTAICSGVTAGAAVWQAEKTASGSEEKTTDLADSSGK